MEYICLYIITAGALIYILKSFLGFIDFIKFKKIKARQLEILSGIRKMLEMEIKNAAKNKKKR